MIRPLRRCHDALFVALALALPLLLASALAVRPDEATTLVDVPAILLDAPGEWTAEGESPLSSAATELAPLLSIDVGELPNSPALLLFWIPGLPSTPGTEGMLPAGARLLGAPRSHRTARYPLPHDALAGDGELVLYSLGHQRIVGLPVPLDAAALAGTVLLGEHATGSTDG